MPAPRKSPAASTLRIGVLVFPGCVRSGAVVPPDVFSTANAITRARSGASAPLLEAVWLAAEGRSQTRGLMFEAAPAHTLDGLQALIVPGVEHQDADDLMRRLEQLGPEQAVLRAAAARGLPILFGCSAFCLVAEAGLLQGRQATTSWWLAPLCRSRYPGVHLDTAHRLTQDGPFVSAAGVTSYFDLALWLVGVHLGADVRQMAARMLLHDSGGGARAQTPYSAPMAASEDDGQAIVERARRWLARRIDRPWSLQELAGHCHTSQRTLLRRFQRFQGTTPVGYMQQLRVERAKALLETTLQPLEEICARCGYQNAAALHKVFKRWAGITPQAYRSRFGLRA